MTAINKNLFELRDSNLPKQPLLGELESKIDMLGYNIDILIQNIIPNVATSHAISNRSKPAARAIDLYGNRRRREKLFGADLFGEPAWDILLDLFIATESGKQISVTSACIGAAVPLTTALRWLSMLEARGLIVRGNDEKDARRSYVRLSQLGQERMVQYLSDY